MSERVIVEDAKMSETNCTENTHQRLNSSGNKRKVPDEDCDFNQTQTDTNVDADVFTDTDIDTNNAPIMSDAEIMKRISKAIPSIQNQSASSLPIITSMIDSDGYLTKPIGTIVSSYKREINVPSTELAANGSAEGAKRETTFILTLANGKSPGVNEYHQQVQKLSLFFIENADDVDLTSNESGGEWNVLYIFCRHADPISAASSAYCSGDTEGQVRMGYRYSLAGFMTLFTFYSPFKKPKSGNVLRICQALVLPPYQRQGHGKAMMRAVYDYAKGSNNDILRSEIDHAKYNINNGDGNGNGDGGGPTFQEIVEVNVEDPAPGFTYMRDGIDYQLFEAMAADAIVSDSESDDDSAIKGILKMGYCKDSCFPVMAETDAITLASKVRITKTQIQIGYEIFKLARMTRFLGNHDCAMEEKVEMEKQFRLMVKKRLNGLHREIIGACPTKVEKQKMLSKLFDESLEVYKSLLRI